jgi:hypothetical protein
MAKINQIKKLCSTKGQLEHHSEHVGQYYFDPFENELLVKSTQVELEKQSQLFKLINLTELIDSNEFLNLTPAAVRMNVRENFKKFLSRSRFDLCHEKEIIFHNLPMYIIPVSQPKPLLDNQQLFIGFRGIEVWQRKQKRSIESLMRRVSQIMMSLDIIHIIASKHLGPIMKKTHENFIKWFIGLMFDQTEGRLPLFGWVRITSLLPNREPEKLFSDPQKYLARALMYPGNLHTNGANYISNQLFGFWYEQIALKDLYEQHCYAPNSYSDLLSSILKADFSHRSEDQVTYL